MTEKKLNHILILFLSTYASVSESTPSSLNIAAPNGRTRAFLLHIYLLHIKVSENGCMNVISQYIIQCIVHISFSV